MGLTLGWTAGAAVALALGWASPALAAAPGRLTVGDQERPLNVEGAPRFGWMPPSDQTAYELKVDGVWDSGKVATSEQSYVAYAGPALDRGASYTWSVRTWDRGDVASDWAPAAHFDTGLTDAGWSGAQWIRRVTSGNDSTDDWTLARKRFTVAASPVVRARVYASAIGDYEVHGPHGRPRRQLRLSRRGPVLRLRRDRLCDRGGAAGARRALSLLDLHLPGPRQRPGRQHDAGGGERRRGDEPEGRERGGVRPRRPAHGRRRGDHGHGDRHGWGRRDRHHLHAGARRRARRRLGGGGLRRGRPVC